MKYLHLFVFIVLISGFSPVSGQTHFRVIGDIPHLPFLNPASVTSPETGMLVFSSTDSKPMIFTGSSWETLCTDNITSLTAQEYFIVKNGIPFLPTFSSPPTGMLASGTIYYSTIQKALMVYNGLSWIKMIDLLTGTIAVSSGFSAGVGVKTVKLPVLSSNPTNPRLVAGAFYINAASKIIRYFDGSLWQDVSCQAVVHTLPVISVTAYTSGSGGNVTTNGGSGITLTGICWSPVADPDTLLTSKTRIVTTGAGLGTFTSQLTGLLPNTTYYVRAYAVNSLGIVYGENRILTTLIQPPTIITLEANTISSISGLSGGDITFDGGSSITKRGIIWSSLSDPLYDPSQVVTNDGSGVGYFPSTLDALLGLTTYYVRAYAVNAAGTSYGNLVEFTTPPPVMAALNQTLSISSVTDNSSVATGLVLNNGGALVTERGICYSTDQINYSYLPSSTLNHTDIGTFMVSLTGLLPGTTYYVKGYARNSVGINYSSETSFTTITLSSLVTIRPVFTGNFSAESGGEVSNTGFSTITGYGICWSTDRNPTVDLPTRTTEIVSGDGTGIFTSTLSGLLNNTTYYIRAYAVNAAGIAYGNLDSVYTAPVTSALLTTTVPSSITGFTASSGGVVSYTGNDILSSRGICWSPDNNPTANLFTKTTEPINGPGKGSFGSHLTGLIPGTKYYVRAYAVNSFGTAYGNLDSLFTAVKPMVTTASPVSMSNTTAVVGGVVTSDGNDPVTERGVCRSEFPNPTTGDSYDTSGSGLGTYVITLKDLMGSTKYYVRAYATNSVGTTYGNLDSLKTSSPLLGVVTTTDIINIGGTTAMGKGKVINNGGALVEERGLCWNTTGNATVDGNHVSCGLGTGGFSGTLSGLTPNTTYYFRAYVINSVGVSYGDDMTFTTFTIATLVTTPASVVTSMTAQSGGTISSDGGALVTSSGICWNTTGIPTVNDKKTSSGLGIGNFIHSLTELMGSTTYYIRAYATNSAGTAYGNEVSFTTSPPIIPTLTTAAALSEDTGLSGTGGGVITNNGGGVITAEGLVWSTTSGFLPDTVTVNKTVQATSGDFTSGLINLQLGTTYYVRAYATNIAGTAYAGNEVSFTTFTLPMITTVAPGSITNVTAGSGGNITSTGGATVEESGICWSTGSLPTISDGLLSDGPDQGLFVRTIQDLMGSTTYYVRAYVRTSVGLVYGQVVSFTTAPPVLATIVTVQPKATSSTGASSGGNILSHGGSMVTSRGIYWSTQENFDPDTITNGKTAQTGYYKGTFNTALTGLIPNTIYYVKAYVINGVGVSYGAEMSFMCPALATLTTATATSNGPTKAVSGGNIANDGGAPITSRGIVWSTVASFNPDTVVVNKTSDGSGIGSFVSQPKGLKGGTTYYVRAYAGNLGGINYGNIVSFITDPATLASLSTRGATFVYGTSAQSGGSVANNGGEPITSSGVVWATSPYFRPDTVVVNKTVQGAAGIGLFGSSISGLSYGTTYYVVAYAVNSIGIAYGTMVSFTTLDFPTLTTLPVYASSDGTQASGGGTLVSNGGTPLTNQGVCWSVNPNPTAGLYTKTTKDGFSGSSFHSTLTGLSPVTKYYVRAYAVNREGTSYGNEVSFTTPAILPAITTIYATPTTTSMVATGGSITFDGGSAVTARGVLWSTNQNFNPDTVVVNRTSNGAGNGNFTSTVTNMRLSTSYYIRAYAVNSIGISYGNQITVTIFPTAPILNTVDLTQITGSSAMSGGVITSDGGAPVTLKGLCWNTSTNPITSNSYTTNGLGTDPFTATLSGLLPNTLYYVRAYAVNKIGTAYGIEKTFQTNGVPTLTATAAVTNIVATTATSGGTITDDGRTRILSRGICWSTFSNPTIAVGTKTVDTTAISLGSFLANIKGLTPGTSYYIRSYATNAVGTGYGSQVMFTTLAVMLPSLTTIHPFNVDTIKATGGGNIFDNGGMPVTVRGICWSTTSSPSPTTALGTKIDNATGGDSIYTNTIAGLLPGTKYYVRAYAINTKGTGYGNLDSLTTHAVRPTVSNVVISHITQSASTDSASVVTDGGAPVTARGLCWNTTGAPTVADYTIPKGAGLGSFTDSLTSLVEGPTYYVRAYATNSAGIRYSPIVSSFRICPTSFTVLHSQGFNGAPVNKTVNYHSVSSSLSGKAACWLTQNLGADHQASSSTDATEASSGWYWQFNRSQGYKHDGTIRTPNTAWITSIPEISNWQTANDPCNLLLSTGWRIPTATEWSNADATSDWNTSTDTWNSVLKLHMGGYLTTTGTLASRGGEADYWASTVIDASSAKCFSYNGSTSTMYNNTKTLGLTIRCIRDTIVIAVPTVTDVTVPTETMTANTAIGLANVTSDGGASLLARGLCWNTTGNPTILDNKISIGSGLGSISEMLSSLIEGPTYYVLAFATNTKGTAYSSHITTFKICPPSFTVQHVQGLNGAPVSKTVTYHSITANISGSPKCWLTQNLGADQQATSVSDATEASAGWYWQFNRAQGFKHDGTTRTPASSWIGSISENSNWLPANDPCTLQLGSGWRIPTFVEWTNVLSSPQPWTTSADAYASVLKLHMAGDLDNTNGSLYIRGSIAYYWSSTQSSNGNGNNIWFRNSNCSLSNISKAYPFTLRCICDTIVLSVSDVTIPNATMTANTATVSAQVIADGGSTLTSRGICWNTTGNPTVSDHVLATGSGLGSVSEIMTGLIEGPTYYVRAFATNSTGTVYSPHVNGFKICNPFTAVHVAGVNGAPVNKTVTYGTVSSSISGAPRCWLTQNLGADQQATSVSDATEPSAGWYWQFNRLQGYKHDGTTRTPASVWITSISESSDWLPVNDPCANLLGLGWRLPTSSEWTNVVGSPQYWNTATDAYASVLKLHLASSLDYSNGTFNPRGSAGYYWSSTQSTTGNGYNFWMNSSNTVVNTNYKTYPFPVRCLRDTISIAVPTVSNVTVPTASMTVNSAVGSASVLSNGGATLSARGLCWNTTGTPTVTDNKSIDGSTGTGTFSATMSGLAPGTTYYVRAFATNTLGTAYSPDVISFTTSIPMTVVSVTPSVGPTTGGTNVTITGTRFLGGNDSYTKLLLHSDGSGSIFTDSSPSAKTVTAFGNTTQSTSQSEFGGSSIYFDGSGDYLTLPTSADFDPGTSDFTIDTWIYPTSLNVKLAQFGNAGNNTGYALGMSSGQISFIAWQLGGVIVNSGSNTVPINTWSHIALARDGQYFKIYINGTLAGTSGAYSGAISTGGAYNSIGTGYDSNGGGYGYGGYFSGYIDEFRFSKDIKRWTGNFSSPINAYASNPTVTVGGAAATNVSFANSTTITGSTPARSVGPSDVTVTNSNGQSATLTGGFTYNGPTVSTISPTSGLTIGGTNVMITGTNFLGGNDSSTKFLLHSDGNGSLFTDSSPNAKTVNANGNATQSTTLSKFGGSSAYFDGSGDYLTIPTSADFDPGISNFSMDTWIYPTASTLKIAQFGNAGTNAAYTLCITNGQITFIAWQLGGVLVTSGSTTVPINAWSHVALARDGQYFRIYINGTLAGTSSAYSGAISTGGAYNSIGTGYDSNGGGYGYGGYFSGYIDEFRISKDVNRWTNNFTPPNNAYDQNPTITFGAAAATNVNFVNSTTIYANIPANTAGTVDVAVTNNDGQGAILSGGFTYIAPTVTAISPTNGLTAGGTNVTITGTNILGGNDSYTKLLIHGDGSGSTFTDSSPGAKIVTSSGNVSQSTSISKFGGSSAYFDGSGDYLTLPTSSDFDPGTSNFTIDAWIYPTAASSKIAQFGNAGANTAYTLYITSGQINFIAWQLGGVLVTSGSTTVPINAWSHVALTRDGQYFKIYINGTLAGTSGAYSGAISTGGAYNSIGTGYDSNGGGYGYGGYFSGYIDDFRFSKDIKRWTSNFTPPSNAYAPNPVITVGGNTVTNVNFINSTTITADTPANSVGAKDVNVTNYDGKGGTLSGGFTYK